MESRSLREVAVKQSVRSFGGRIHLGLEEEAKFYSLFAEAHSQHIVKMYRRLYTDRGAGYGRFDVGIVDRIFLEYCPGGCLADQQEKKMRL